MRSEPYAPLFLSGLPPSRAQARACAVVAVALLLAFLATLPFASVPLPHLHAFIPIVDTALILGDLITASLLFAQFSVQRSRALLALASGYLFTGLIMIPHLLSFPGAFTETGLLGAGVNTTIWLYYFWHFGLPVAVIAYALWKRSESSPLVPARANRLAMTCVAGIVALVAGLTVLATAGHERLPSMMSDAIHWSPERLRIVALLIFALLAAAMILLWRGQRSVLDLWLLVSLWAWLIELVMVTFTSERFSLLWFTGRFYGLLAGIFVLLMLLWETNRLYAQLAVAAARRRDERESRLATMEALSAAIDHEIRQPLGAMVANANAGRRWIARTPPVVSEALQAFEAISADGHRAAEVIRSIRAIFSRREQGMALQDMGLILRDCLGVVDDEMRSGGVEIELEAVAVPAVMGDAGQLKQVLVNLFHNALDAMQADPQGQSVLTVRLHPQEEGGLQLEIGDNGPGVSPEIVDRIFDPFFTTKRKGMGMGLAICRSIVEEHGGHLEVHPVHPRGARFRIVLPGVE